MRFICNPTGRQADIAELFRHTLTSSEGESEGHAIGELVEQILTHTPSEDLWVFVAQEADDIVGCILFTRMRYSQEDRLVFLLAPVAIVPTYQCQGLGQQLIREGISKLRESGVAVALTYGDPAFYGKTGFQPVTEVDVPAPYSLTQPHGWQAMALDSVEPVKLRGIAQCVSAFNVPGHW